MRPILTVIFFTLIVLPAVSVAQAESYMDMDIPVMEGATNVKDERDDTLYQREVSYDLVIKEPEKIFEFYDAVFKKDGWVNKTLNHPNHKEFMRWSFHYTSFEDFKILGASQSTSWRYPDLPLVLRIRLKLQDNLDTGFITRVHVTFYPVFQDFLMEKIKLKHRILESSENIIIIKNTFGGYALAFKNVNLNAIDQKYKDEPIVKKYIETYETLVKKSEEFADIYIRKIKPVPENNDLDPFRKYYAFDRDFEAVILEPAHKPNEASKPE